ncbi:52 kDa repressor of the inhibitor of the protein kinase-like isoform X2 [Pristis pectinata]|uniref:52 kDa repressor of the inhibitor of the protein kinase-like isoform X2 n=1 Tax=Pristis pectinata TaxID=685728 RepID=UPI00223CB819|nr:52 kDa repressor of the inhibitor of the protein kinase-like isoform X2 [Pristis pectinata]
MPNFCAAPNCSRGSTNYPDLPFFRFPRDPERCQKWVENCRRADLENRSAEQLHKQYRLCARHFEQSLICTNTFDLDLVWPLLEVSQNKNDCSCWNLSPYRTVLKDNAVPTLFDLTSHLNKPEGKHRKHKMIKELTEEDLLRVKAPRTDGDVLRGLQCKQEPINELEKTDLEGATESLEESTLLEESLNLTPEEKGNKEFLKVLFETVLLLGRQNVPLGGSATENVSNLCNTQDNIQALLEFRMNAGDEILRKRFETTAVNAVYCPKNLQKDLLDICEMCIREEVLREVRDSNFFSIVTDDVINIAGVDHVSLLIRFVDESDSLRQEFVGFIPCELDGEFLASRIHETLTEKWGLNMYYCRGQAYNGSGAMSYKKQVVVASILQQCPKALCTPCSSYPLNIWMAKSSLIFGISMVLSLMENIVSFFSLSPQLQKVFDVSVDSIYQTNEEKAKELKKLFQINWYERHDTFEILADLYEVLVTCLDEISYDTCGRWNAEIATQASMLSSTMRDFEIVVSLMVLKNVLSYTRAFGKNLQGQASDTYFASSTLTAVLHSLNEMRDNIEVYHEFWLEEATNLSFKMGIELKLPWRCRRQPQNEEVSEETPENYYKESITAPFLDHIILEIEDMFSEQQLKALKCLSLVPSVMAQLKYNTGEENMADLYKDDLPNPDTLSAELHCWKIKWKHRSRDVELPSTIFDTLRHPDIKFFPNVYTLLKIVSNLPIIKLETDKCDIGRKRLKAYLKVTPVEERTSSLALIHINYDAKHDYDMMVDTYAKLYPEKMQLPHVTDSDNVEVNNHDGSRVEVNNLGTGTGPLYEVDSDCMEVVSHTLVSGIVLHHQSPGSILEACQNPSKNVIEVTQHPEGSTVELQQLPVGSTMIVTQHSTEPSVELQHHPEGAEPDQPPVGSTVEVQHHIEGRVVEVIHHPEMNGVELQHRSEVNGMELEHHREEVIEVSHHSEMRAVEFTPQLEGSTVELQHHVHGVAVTLQHHIEGSTVELQHHPEDTTVEMRHAETSAVELSHHVEESAMEVDHYPESSTTDLQQHLESSAIELQHQLQPEPVTTEILCHPESREGEVQHSLETVAAEVQHPPDSGEHHPQTTEAEVHHPEPGALEIQHRSESVTSQIPQHPEPPSTDVQHHPEPVAMVTQHPSEPVTSETELHLESASSEIQQHSEQSAIVIQHHPETVAAEIQHYSEPVAKESSATVIQNYSEPVTTDLQQHPEPVTTQIHHPGPTVMIIESHPESTVAEIQQHPTPSALLIEQHPEPATTEIQDHSEAGARDVHHHPEPNALELQSHLASDIVVEGCPQVNTVELEHQSVARVVETSTVELENCSETVELQEHPEGGTVEVDSVSVCTQDVSGEGIKILQVKNSEESNSETNISSVSNVNNSEVAVQ